MNNSNSGNTQAHNPEARNVTNELARLDRQLDSLRDDSANLLHCVCLLAEDVGWNVPSVVRGLKLVDEMERKEGELLQERWRLWLAATLIPTRTAKKAS